jgi:tRNA 2-thiouridine synthesizing protein A
VSETFVDARGLKCPWPALRLAKEMRSAARVRIAADDPQVSSEFRMLATEQGWSIQELDGEYVVERPLVANS